MKKRTKFTLAGIVAVTGLLAISGCTKSFCSNNDTARMLYAFDDGVTQYGYDEGGETIEITAGELTYKVTNLNKTYAIWYEEAFSFVVGEEKTLTYLNEINKAALDAGVQPIDANHLDYYRLFDEIYLNRALVQALLDKNESIEVDMKSDAEVLQRDLSYYSYLKFLEGNDYPIWGGWDNIDHQIRITIDLDKCPSTDFVAIYKSKMNNYVAQYRTCLTTKTDKYGAYGYSTDGIFVEKKSWGYAWSKGFFEGLLVYPIGWLIDKIAFGFKDAGVAAGWSALLAILFVTLIVRGIMMLATIKQTAGNAKMTELQPEITKIQNKYPNANTNRMEKQRMAEEMNRLYRKNKINPFTAIIVMIVQFPIFICVWGALSGNSALSSGKVLGLDLSLTIREVLFTKANWSSVGGYAALTALFLFLFMALAQATSMLLPQWIQKAKAKKVARLGKNPAQNQQQNKMKWFTYIMLAMIIFMGFSLVSAMGVYWLIGALISIAQTLVMQSIAARRKAQK